MLSRLTHCHDVGARGLGSRKHGVTPITMRGCGQAGSAIAADLDEGHHVDGVTGTS
jgi:hypothetical protein